MKKTEIQRKKVPIKRITSDILKILNKLEPQESRNDDNEPKYFVTDNEWEPWELDLRGTTSELAPIKEFVSLTDSSGGSLRRIS